MPIHTAITALLDIGTYFVFGGFGIGKLGVSVDVFRCGSSGGGVNFDGSPSSCWCFDRPPRVEFAAG